MQAPSLRFPTLVIAAFLAVACIDISTGLEHWPFGSYPMYSLLYSDQLTWLRLYGVTDRGEVPLRGERDFAPFDEARLVMALQRLEGAPAPNQKLTAALGNLMQLYNRAAARRRPAGPPLRALRLYTVRWPLQPGVTGTEAPRERSLVAQANRDDNRDDSRDEAAP